MSEYMKCTLLRGTAASAIIFRNDVNVWERGSVVIKVTRYLTDSTIVDSYSQYEWINIKGVCFATDRNSRFRSPPYTVSGLKRLSLFKSVQKKEKKVVDLC